MIAFGGIDFDRGLCPPIPRTSSVRQRVQMNRTLANRVGALRSLKDYSRTACAAFLLEAAPLWKC